MALSAESQAHLDKAVKIAMKVNEWIQAIRAAIEGFQKKMLEIIQKAQDAVTNAAGRSQKAIDRELQKLQKKLDEYHKTAQEWVDKQLESVQKWMDDQMEAIQQEIKESAARVEAQIIECSTGVKLTGDQIKEISSAVPDIPIPKPSIPQIPVPKPEFPYPNINLEQLASEVMAASGANDLAGAGRKLATTKLI